ncbi:MAG: hypothetical protein IPK03_16610 [Bacteroidetes bacterium]|nr:hypothetical protein [Bacteroidota bacterium]
MNANISDPADQMCSFQNSITLLFGIRIFPAIKNAYKTSYHQPGQVTDSYWTDTWNAWKSAPTVTCKYHWGA